jgi:peptidylprolyl isomerase
MKEILSVILMIFVAGCTATGNVGGETVTAQKGDHVFVDYTGTLDDGTQFDSSEGREPLEFDVGTGQMIAGFDNGVVGMKEGDEKSIKIAPDQAYGEKDSSLVRDVPKSQVPPGVKEGDTLSAQGQPVKVVNVGGENVTIDFNHPLAGEALNFKIKMVKIEKK